MRTWTKLEEIELMLPAEQTTNSEEISDQIGDYYVEIAPRFAQPEALSN